MKVRHLLQILNIDNESFLTIKNYNNDKSKDYINKSFLTEYQKNRNVIAYTYSFLNKSIILYVE